MPHAVINGFFRARSGKQKPYFSNDIFRLRNNDNGEECSEISVTLHRIQFSVCAEIPTHETLAGKNNICHFTEKPTYTTISNALSNEKIPPRGKKKKVEKRFMPFWAQTFTRKTYVADKVFRRGSRVFPCPCRGLGRSRSGRSRLCRWPEVVACRRREIEVRKTDEPSRIRSC